MNDRTERLLLFVGSQLVFVAALLHFALGVLNWVRWYRAGFLIPADGRWPLFVVSGLAIIAGMVLAAWADDRRPYYLAGAVAMLGYAVGYFTYHLLGHRPWILLGRGAGTESIGLQWFVDHALAGPLETVSLLVEVVAAAILLALYLGASRSDGQLTLDEAAGVQASDDADEGSSG